MGGRRSANKSPWEPLVISEDETETDSKHPLSVLARAASMLNPKQFDLPKDAVCPMYLQGGLAGQKIAMG